MELSTTNGKRERRKIDFSCQRSWPHFGVMKRFHPREGCRMSHAAVKCFNESSGGFEDVVISVFKFKYFFSEFLESYFYEIMFKDLINKAFAQQFVFNEKRPNYKIVNLHFFHRIKKRILQIINLNYVGLSQNPRPRNSLTSSAVSRDRSCGGVAFFHSSLLSFHPPFVR